MKIVTFGELMLRLAPEGYLRFLQEPRFSATFGGGEANVAVSLAQFGEDARFVTRLPKHEIGQAALCELKKFGVDVSAVSRGGERLGIYFVEKGASQRPGKVVYDRAHSAFCESIPQDYDWESVFCGADWFHFTGITPALSPGLAQITEQAAEAAKRAGCTVSCDLNYRNKLWSRERAGEVMSGLCRHVDVLVGNEEDAENVFGIRAEGTSVTEGRLDYRRYESVAAQLSERFGFGRVAVTLRTSLSASDNRWAAMLSEGGKCYFSRTYPIHIVDRVGGGDSFAAGLIYALRAGKRGAQAVEFAAGASCLKHTVEGDFNRVTVEEVEKLVAGDGSGRVER